MESSKGAANDVPHSASTAPAIGLIIVAATVITMALLFRDRSPDPSPSPPNPTPTGPASNPSRSPETPAPTLTLRPDNLPDAQDLEWDTQGDWRATDYASIEMTCLPRRLTRHNEGLLGGFRRHYVLNRGSGVATVTVVEFDTVKNGTRAAGSIEEQLRNCTPEMERAGHVGVRELPARPVPLGRDDAEAVFVEYIYDTTEKSDPESGVFDAQAVAWSGRRIALVTMAVQRQEDYWSFPGETGSGYPLHPIYRCLPRIVDRMMAS